MRGTLGKFSFFVVAGLCLAVVPPAWSEERLVEVSWPAPISFADGVKNGPVPEGMKEMKPIEILGMPMRAYDMRGWFASQGVKIPQDGLAIYVQEANVVMLKTSKEGMKAFGDPTMKPRESFQLTTATEFYLVSCRLPGAALEKELTYRELRATAGDSWKVVNVASCILKSGMHGAADPSGAALDAEVTVGPDNTAIDVSYRYGFKGSTPDGTRIELTNESATTTKSGVFNILQMAGQSQKDGVTYVLLMRSSVLLPGNVPLPPLEKEPTEEF